MQIFELLTQTALPTRNQYIQKHPKVGCIRIILLELATSRERRKLEKKKSEENDRHKWNFEQNIQNILHQGIFKKNKTFS